MLGDRGTDLRQAEVTGRTVEQTRAKLFSNRATALLTAEREVDSRRAASAKLPASTTAGEDCTSG